MQVTVLGSGTSHGVPMIGCGCDVCTSSDPRDRRTRPSIAVELNTGIILVDTAPELRLQAVANQLCRVDAVLFTHTHADHTHGIDDLRIYNARQGVSLPLYGSPASMRDIRSRFDYIFTATQIGGGVPMLDLHPVTGPFEVLDHTVVPVEVLHGYLPVYGFRFGRFAYVTDCSTIPPSSMEVLTDLDVLILDGLRHKPHPTHFNIEQALAVIEELRPRMAYLTHLTHDVSHERVSRELPPGVELAYDGLSFSVRW